MKKKILIFIIYKKSIRKKDEKNIIMYESSFMFKNIFNLFNIHCTEIFTIQTISNEKI